MSVTSGELFQVKAHELPLSSGTLMLDEGIALIFCVWQGGKAKKLS